MTPQERRQLILAELNEIGTTDVAKLSEKFGCSRVTVRSDLRFLEQEGYLSRTHGGAMPLDTSAKPNEKYAYKSIYKNIENKKAICSYAYEQIEDMDVIFIDESSTGFYLAQLLKEKEEKKVFIVTNSLLIGTELSESRHIEVYVIGGYVSGSAACALGTEAEKQVLGYHLSKAFLGTHSINLEVGITAIAAPQMQMKRAAMKVSKKTYFLADSSKFDGSYLSVICPATDVDMIITDKGISQTNIDLANKLGVNLKIAE